MFLKIFQIVIFPIFVTRRDKNSKNIQINFVKIEGTSTT